MSFWSDISKTMTFTPKGPNGEQVTDAGGGRYQYLAGGRIWQDFDPDELQNQYLEFKAQNPLSLASGLENIPGYIPTQAGGATGGGTNVTRFRDPDTGKEYYGFGQGRRTDPEGGYDPGQAPWNIAGSIAGTPSDRLSYGSTQGDRFDYNGKIIGETDFGGQRYSLTDAVGDTAMTAPARDDPGPEQMMFNPFQAGSFANFAGKAAGVYGGVNALANFAGPALSGITGTTQPASLPASEYSAAIEDAIANNERFARLAGGTSTEVAAGGAADGFGTGLKTTGFDPANLGITNPSSAIGLGAGLNAGGSAGLVGMGGGVGLGAGALGSVANGFNSGINLGSAAAGGLGIGTGAPAAVTPGLIQQLANYTGLSTGAIERLGGAAISSLAGLYGANVVGNAADRAANRLAESNQAATQLQSKMYEDQVARQQPFYQAGINALPAYTKGVMPGGDLVRPFSMADYQADPGYGFRLSEGMKALDRTAASRGNLLSGATFKGAQRFNQDMASNEYNNAYNRYVGNQATQRNALAGLTGFAPTAAQQLNASGANYASNVTDLGTSTARNYANADLTGAAARQSAYGGAGGAFANALSPNPYIAFLNKQMGVIG